MPIIGPGSGRGPVGRVRGPSHALEIKLPCLLCTYFWVHAIPAMPLLVKGVLQFSVFFQTSKEAAFGGFLSRLKKALNCSAPLGHSLAQMSVSGLGKPNVA